MLIFHIWFLIYAADKFYHSKFAIDKFVSTEMLTVFHYFCFWRQLIFEGVKQLCPTNFIHVHAGDSFQCLRNKVSHREWYGLELEWTLPENLNSHHEIFISCPMTVFFFPRLWWKFISAVFPWRVTFIENLIELLQV